MLTSPRVFGALSALVLVVGCSGDEPPATKDAIEVIDDSDADGDGYAALIDGGEDCDDNNEEVNPGEGEDCDGIDNDCDGDIDDGVMISSFTDSDGDGFGDDATEVISCDIPPDTVQEGGDCADDDTTRFPGAIEICNGIDDDCEDSTPDAFVIPGVDNYATLEDAIADASPGDTIEVCDGVYTVAGVLTEGDVTIVSHSGDAATVTFEGDASRSLLAIASGTLTLRDLTLTGGLGSMAPSLYGGTIGSGGAVNALQGTLHVDGCVFEGNGADLGGALGMLSGSVTDSVFRDNIGMPANYGFGGALYVALGGTVDVTGSTFENNEGNYGGALLSSGTLSVSSSLFTGNNGITSAGAIYVDNNSTLSLVDTEISGNTAQFGGGLLLEAATATADALTVISGNTATLVGGGIELYATGTTSWSGGLVTGNSSLGEGGGIHADRDSPNYYYYTPGSISISDVIIEGNTAIADGGGLYAIGSPVSISALDISANSAARGGGLALSTSAAGLPFDLLDLSITDNEAGQGGGLWFSLADVQLTDSSLSGNNATDGGGGIYLEQQAEILGNNNTFADDPDENTPEDLRAVNPSGDQVNYDFDGPTNARCTSSTPECLILE